MTRSSLSSPFRTVEEVRGAGPLPLFLHPEWEERFPWLVQGTTGRGGEGEDDFDLRLFGTSPVGPTLARWRTLREATGLPRAIHAHQVHAATLLVHGGGPPGLFLADDADAHATRAPGVLLTVSVADCIPITIVDAEHRAVALLHAGWRGVVAGVVEAGIAALRDLVESDPSRLFLHLGPAICGACYEVGPEVHVALGLEPPPGPTPVDLRAVAARRAAGRGITPERITLSAYCTRCSNGRFFSHRGGDAGRQVGYAGIRPGGASRSV